MRDSVGKEISRRMYYQECIPTWLKSELIQSGYFLTLLSSPPRELSHLDNLGVKRQRVISVEHTLSVFREQMEMFQGEDQKVCLHYGCMDEYLQYLLHENKKLVSLNLDIEGTYLNNLDPAMTEVLLFCWRNPTTMVATYSSVGRDRTTIWEGLKSLLLFLVLDPKRTLRLMHTLSLRYEQAGSTEPQFMTLRTMFWLRSVMEHNMRAAACVGKLGQSAFISALNFGDQAWTALVKTRPIVYKLRQLEEFANLVRQTTSAKTWLSTMNSKFLHLTLGEMKHVLYNAQFPWSQLCQFVKFQTNTVPVSCIEWFGSSTDLLVRTPLTYITREGKVYKLDTQMRLPSVDAIDYLVFHEHGASKKYVPRKLSFKVVQPHLAGMAQTVNSLRHKNRI